MIVEGCPQNIGQIVEVVTHIGPFRVFNDVYVVKTASGSPFKQVVSGWLTEPGKSAVQYAQRHQLKPLAGNQSNVGRQSIETHN